MPPERGWPFASVFTAQKQKANTRRQRHPHILCKAALNGSRAMTDENKPKHVHSSIPAEMTPPGWGFHKEHERLFGFIIYVTQLAISTDEKAKIAVRALYELDEPDKYQAAMENIEKRGATRALRKLHRTLILEMMLCRATDNFLTYLSELLALVFRSRPETLRSAETVRLDKVLKHATMEDLVRDLAERKVNQLSYQGMRDLSAYLSERLGFELFPNALNLERAVRTIEFRNLIVHNRGIVNDLFLSRVPGEAGKVGEPLNLDTDQIFDDLNFIAVSVYDVDSRAVEKFRLPVGPHPTNAVAA